MVVLISLAIGIIKHFVTKLVTIKIPNILRYKQQTNRYMLCTLFFFEVKELDYLKYKKVLSKLCLVYPRQA